MLDGPGETEPAAEAAPAAPPAPRQAPATPVPGAPGQAASPIAPAAPSSLPAPSAPVPAPAAVAPPIAADAAGATPALSRDEALGFYQDVMLTYAFDACGLPLLGTISREDMVRRIEVCPAPAARKESLRSVFKRAIADAERDPAKTRAEALMFCNDKRAFLRNVMHHASELTFEADAPPNCGLISPPSPQP